MTGTIADWWSGLSARERWLVGAAGALLTIVIGWLLILAPLLGALSRSSDNLALAIDRQAAIAGRVAEIHNLEARQSSRPADASANPSATPLGLVLSQSAAEKGFTLGRNDAQGSDAATITIANGRAPALISWISELEGGGILASEVALRPNADGTVALTATLRRVQ